jgi:alkylresorcinol/alkylpyrone synthase
LVPANVTGAAAWRGKEWNESPLQLDAIELTGLAECLRLNPRFAGERTGCPFLSTQHRLGTTGSPAASYPERSAPMNPALSFPMFNIGIAIATPPQHYQQIDFWDALQASVRFASLAPVPRHSEKGPDRQQWIKTRHLRCNGLGAFEMTPDALHSALRRTPPSRATGRGASARRSLKPDQIDRSSSARAPAIVSRFDKLLDPSARIEAGRAGAESGRPGLRRGDSNFHRGGLADSGKCGRVLTVCVEVCSAAFYLDDDPACSSARASATAQVLRNADDIRRIQWKLAVQLDPNQRDTLRFELRNGMLRNIHPRPLKQPMR